MIKDKHIKASESPQLDYLVFLDRLSNPFLPETHIVASSRCLPSTPSLVLNPPFAHPQSPFSRRCPVLPDAPPWDIPRDLALDERPGRRASLISIYASRRKVRIIRRFQARLNIIHS